MAYDLGGVRPQRARRQLDGARVSARELRAEPYPTFRRRAPRHGCQPCLRGSRPSSRVPSALSLSASRLCGTHSTRTVRPTGTCRAPATVAAGCVCVRSADGTTTALHRRPGKGTARARSARNRRPLPLPRLEQLRVEGSPLSRGGRDHCAASKTRGPVSTDGRAAPLGVARRRAAMAGKGRAASGCEQQVASTTQPGHDGDAQSACALVCVHSVSQCSQPCY